MTEPAKQPSRYNNDDDEQSSRRWSWWFGGPEVGVVPRRGVFAKTILCPAAAHDDFPLLCNHLDHLFLYIAYPMLGARTITTDPHRQLES